MFRYNTGEIDENQVYLLDAIDELREKGEEFILDGHFCLLNRDGFISRIPMNTFASLNPDKIVLLTEQPSVIATRRLTRDGIVVKESDIDSFQREEKIYAEEIAKKLGVPLIVSIGSSDLENVIQKIRKEGCKVAGKFYLKKFSEIDLGDSFFDSLKSDYPGNENSTGFEDWFCKKANEGSTALVFEDEIGVGAFVVLKNECEEIRLQKGILPSINRIKISTFRIAERFRRQRIGEGAIGLVLWKWQQSNCEEIYVTVFDKHETLISQFERFGFQNVGKNANGENVLVKSHTCIDFSDAYKAFPFIKSDFEYAGYVIVDDNYHDTMFAYSELANTASLQRKISSSVSNGLSKIYVGQAQIKHRVGEPVLIYRRYTQGTGKRFRSCITSYCIVTDIIQAKKNNRCLMTFEELKQRIGNKSVFDEAELLRQYNTFRNLTITEMLYYGYFGAGNNVNMNWLDNNGCWAAEGQYPTDVHLTEKQFRKILVEGNVNVSNVIID